MLNDNDLPALDDLVDAVVARLAGRLPKGPLGDPVLPPGVEPQIPVMPIPQFFTGARLRIAGVEFTQSTQHHGAAGPSYGADNSVPLVAYKPMVARAYPQVQRGIFGGDSLTGSRVTGELILSIGHRVVYRTGPTRWDGVRVGDPNHVSRTMWDGEITAFGGGGGGILDATPLIINSPLNFEVPAYWCKRGRVHASVRIWPVNDGPTSGRTATHNEYLQFHNVRAPKVCLVRVNWQDAAGTTFSPTDQQMLDTMRLATRMLPFPYFETTILGVEQTKNGAFAMVAASGRCNTAWNDLLEDLDNVRIWTRLFQIGDIVYGMVPTNAIPAGGGTINAGCGDVSGGGFVGFESTFAHELGHLYDAKHVFVPGDDDNEPNYPAYGRRRSIGEVGIDTGTTPPTLYDPDDAIDIMAYQTPSDPEPQWISPFTYEKMLDNRWLQAAENIDPGRVRPVLVLSLRIYREVEGVARIDVRKAATVEAPGPLPLRLETAMSPLSIDLLDGEGQTLSTHHCTFSVRHGGGGDGCCGPSVPLDREPWLDLTEAIEWSGDVSSLVFHRGGGPLHTIDVGEAPEVAIEGPDHSDDHLTVHVEAHHPRDEVSVVVLFSNDEGSTWQPIAYDPPDGQVTIAIDHLPGGPHCQFRTIGTAELSSATADTEPFDLPPSPRRLYLDAPAGDCTVPPGPVRLGVSVDTRGLGAPAPEEVRWESDIDGDLGSGYAIAPDLEAGEHTVVVTVPDGLGGTLSERAIIVVGGRPQRPMRG
jgi:hypothetical protein